MILKPMKDTLVPYHFEYDLSIPELARKSYNQGGSNSCFIHTSEEIDKNTGFQSMEGPDAD